MIDYFAAKSEDSTVSAFPYASHPAPFDDPHAETTKVSSSAASVNVVAFFMLFDLNKSTTSNAKLS
jgi:hypothetical protein